MGKFSKISRKKFFSSNSCSSEVNSGARDRRKVTGKRHSYETNDGNSVQTISYKSVGILKSPIDARKYEAVKFQNGLQAVIISTYYSENDIDESKSLEPTTCNFWEVYDFNRYFLQMYQKLGPDGDEMSLLEKVVTFPWGGNVDRIGDVHLDEDSLWEPPRKAHRAAYPPESMPELFGISVTVAVGCLHDPLKVSGLAHLLEHCLFLRTQSFPEPWTVIANNSFVANAGTEMEHTFYYANMTTKEEFVQVLHVFSDMIQRPVLDPDDIRREVHAVDTENTIKLSRDFLRIGALFLLCCHKNHHMAKFGMGDISSLGRPDIGKWARDYFHRYYRANYMTLCLQGPLPMEEFIQLAAENFHSLESSDRPTALEEVKRDGFPFDMKLFARSYRVFPFKNVQWMIVSWVLPPEFWLNHVTKPLEYVAHLFSNKGDTGLDHFLKQRGWITCSSTSYTTESLDQDAIFISNSLYSGIHFGLELTDEGLYHETEVLRAIFAYIVTLRKEGPKRRIFNELRTVKANVYHYRTWTEKSVIDLGFSSNRHRNPKLILTAADLLTTYDPVAISKVLDCLRPRQMNLVITSKKFERMVTHIDPTSLVSYHSSHLPELLLQELEAIRPYSEFSLPKPNPYVSDRLCQLVPTEIGGMTVESNLAYLRNSGKAVFVVEHSSGKRGVPEYSNYAVFFASSFCRAHPHNHVLMCLWKRILEQRIQSRIWRAIQADACFGIFEADGGFLIYLSGPASWLPSVWTEVLDEFINSDRYLSEKTFITFKELHMKIFSNANIKYDTLGLVEDLYLYLTTAHYILMSVMETYLRYSKNFFEYNFPPSTSKVGFYVTFDTFISFIRNFKSRMWVFAQINGCVTYPQLDTLARSITVLDFEPLPVGEMCLNCTYSIPRGDRCLRVKAMSKACITSTVWNHYQFGQLTNDDEDMLYLLAKHLSNFMFQQLRTEEQLSYYIKVEADTSFGSSSLSVVVIPQADRFRPGYVDERIDEAFVSFFNKFLQSEDSIRRLFNYPERAKESREYILLREFQDEDEFPKNLRTLYQRYLPFRREKFTVNPHFRKLSLQVQGNLRYDSSVPMEPNLVGLKRKLYETDDKFVSTDGIKHVQGKVVLDLPDDILHENAYFITDLEKFRSNLEMIPSRIRTRNIL